MPRKKEKSRAVRNAEAWDKKHKLLPVRIKTAPDVAEKFIDQCDQYHVSRKMVINELMQEYIDGRIDLHKEKEKEAIVSTKIDHDLYLKMNAQCKKDHISKAKAYSELIAYFVNNTVDVLSGLGIDDIEARPEELLHKLRQIHLEKGRPVRTTDVSDSTMYTKTFGTWPTAIYVCGSIDYPEFVKRRKHNKNPFTENELKWIFVGRKDELQGAPVTQKNFPYPGNDVYQSVMHQTIEALGDMLTAE